MRSVLFFPFFFCFFFLFFYYSILLSFYKSLPESYAFRGLHSGNKVTLVKARRSEANGLL